MDSWLSRINETIEKWVPRKVDQEKVQQLFGSQRYPCHLDSINKALFDPIWDLLDRGGKRWRSTLLLLIAEALGKNPEEVLDFVVLTEIVHNGSLIVSRNVSFSESTYRWTMWKMTVSSGVESPASIR